MPLITDTCSPQLAPSHSEAVATLLHHLLQGNHPHYLMRLHCTQKTLPLPLTHVDGEKPTAQTKKVHKHLSLCYTVNSVAPNATTV